MDNNERKFDPLPVKRAIRSAREKAQISLKDLAKRSNLSTRELTLLESEKNSDRVDLVALCAAARALNLTLGDLLKMSITIDDENHRDAR